jgi:hypothetical protein
VFVVCKLYYNVRLIHSYPKRADKSERERTLHSLLKRQRTREIVLKFSCLLIKLKLSLLPHLQIPASVISSVGMTTNYQRQHHCFVLSNQEATTTLSKETNPTLSANDNVNRQTMIQQTVNVQAPRLHPKKRKFDLSELEDEHQQSPLASSTATSSNAYAALSSASSLPPSTTTVVYHRLSTDPTTHNGGLQPITHYASPSSTNFSNPQHVVTQVVKNTGEAQQFIKRQIPSYR